MKQKVLGEPNKWLAMGVVIALSIALVAYLTIFNQADRFNRAPLGGNWYDSIAEGGPETYADNLDLMARVIQGEAAGEPYLGKVAVGAVLMNRMQNSSFPHTLAGVVFDPDAFESVTNGLIWQSPPSAESIQAAADALSGWDPTYGSIFFWNPSKPVSAWIWSRPIVTQIGNHVFAR